VIDFPPSDPAFDLPMQSLIKFNCFRDLDYLQKTIPDLAAFRLAYRTIKAWAKQRGVYSSKLGYLGGIHITLLLSRICKLLFRQHRTTTVPDIVYTFFNHYANLDWDKGIIFDPFFYKQEPRYHRTIREPLVILGIHAPKVNVAHTASLPSSAVLIEEFRRADGFLSSDMATWNEFLSETKSRSGVVDFLECYKTYIKIDVHYWGMSSVKGKMLVGWLESRCILLLVGK
jgi:poly(A) polymerase Pap1